MMRSGGRRGNFRGTVESPFLRHRFTDARQDNLLPSLREAAAALCRNADRETLVEVVKLLEGADPRNKLARVGEPMPQERRLDGAAEVASASSRAHHLSHSFCSQGECCRFYK